MLWLMLKMLFELYVLEEDSFLCSDASCYSYLILLFSSLIFCRYVGQRWLFDACSRSRDSLVDADTVSHTQHLSITVSQSLDACSPPNWEQRLMLVQLFSGLGQNDVFPAQLVNVVVRFVDGNHEIFDLHCFRKPSRTIIECQLFIGWPYI